jgi:glycosyltransferase involved in cell wall biosynthesis
VPAKSSEALATAILRIFEDDSLALRMGQISRKLCETIYDWKLISKRYAELYFNINA